MNIQTKQLKYRLKALSAGFVPRLHWASREALFGLLEPELGLLPLLCQADALFVDVGANWGAYCHHARRWSKGVVAFEPQPRLAAVLRRALGKRSGCRVWEAAVSDVAGRVQLRIPVNDLGYSTVEPSNLLQGTADLRLGVNVVDVERVRLDDMGLGTVGCIKIDVEGHELSVIDGAKELIARDRPHLIVETEDRHCLGAR
jgi:FkbM family methyltransferase